MFVQDFILPQLIGKDINEMWHLVDPMGLLAAMLKTQGRGEPEARYAMRNTCTVFICVRHKPGLYSAPVDW